MSRRIAHIPVLLGLLALVGVAAVPAQAKRNLAPGPDLEHRPSGRRGRVPLKHPVRVPPGAGRRREHARAGHRRDQGRPGRRHARHDRGPHHQRPRDDRVEDAEPDAEARRRVLVLTDGTDHYRHGRPASAYRFRGVATGRKPPPRGFSASDFRVPTLKAVLKAFPHTPINVEIKGRTKQEACRSTSTNAGALARLLRTVHRQDLIVVSFKQQAVDRFHALVPGLPLAPGVDGDAAWLLNNQSPGPGVVAFQVPITYKIGNKLADHHGRKRRAGPPRRLRVADVVRRPGRGRPDVLVEADRRLRGRRDDVEAGRIPARQALASRAGQLPATLTSRGLH